MYVDQAARSVPVLFPNQTGRVWGNASSSHRMGREAQEALKGAQQQLAERFTQAQNALFLSWNRGGFRRGRGVHQRGHGKQQHRVATTHVAVHRHRTHGTSFRVLHRAVHGQSPIV